MRPNSAFIVCNDTVESFILILVIPQLGPPSQLTPAPNVLDGNWNPSLILHDITIAWYHKDPSFQTQTSLSKAGGPNHSKSRCWVLCPWVFWKSFLHFVPLQDMNLFYSLGDSEVFLSLQVLCRNADAIGGSFAGILATWLFSINPSAPFIFGTGMASSWVRKVRNMIDIGSIQNKIEHMNC